jgi:hypothetical protein
VAAVSGGIHGEQLNREIAAVAEAAARRMIQQAGEMLRRSGEPPLNQEWIDYFSSLTRPPATSIRFLEPLEAGGVNAVVAAIPAFVGEKLGRPPQWLGDVRAEVQRLIENLIAAMRSRRPRLLEGFERLYSLQPAESPMPDQSALRRLQDARNRLRELADEAAKLAKPAAAAAAPRGWKQGLGG